MLYLFDYSVDDVGKVENVPDDLIFPIFGYLESHSNFNFVLLFTYLFTLLHNNNKGYLYRVSTLHFRCQSLISFWRPGWCCDHILVRFGQILGFFWNSNYYQFWRTIFHEFGESIMKGRLWCWRHSYSTCIIKSHNSRKIRI